MTDCNNGHDSPGDQDNYEKAERDALYNNYKHRLDIIADRTRGVAEYDQTGVYIAGRPGTSKTTTVIATLEKLSRPYVVINARMTAMGLFRELEEHPEHVIVIDDVPALFKDQQALSILLAALDGTPGEARRVTYRSKDNSFEVMFRGGIIAIGNLRASRDPLFAALQSRIVVLEHDPPDDEVAECMYRAAEKGFSSLTSDECREVVDFLIEETRRYDGRLDFRHFEKALRDRLQYQSGRASTHWTVLVRSSLRQMVCEPAWPNRKSEEMEQQRVRVRDAIAKHPEDRQAQVRESGLSRSTFYVRLAEIEREDRNPPSGLNSAV